MILPIKVAVEHVKPIIDRMQRVAAEYGTNAPVIFAAISQLAHEGEIGNSSQLIAALDILLGEDAISQVVATA